MDGIMAFAAHPDDEGAILGTLAKYASLSRKVVIVWGTKGERWLTPFGKYSPLLHWLLFTKEKPKIRNKLHKIIGNIRTKEIEKVLSLIKVHGEFLDFLDGSIPPPSDIGALKKVIEIIRNYHPRVVITHHFRETHSDHQNLSNLIYQAFLLSGSNKIRTKSPPFSPELLAWWDERGFGFKPNCFLNIKDTIGIFKEWKKIYKSQATRIVGQIPIIKARLRAFRTPYRLVEAFQIVNVKMRKKWYGELFPVIDL